MTAIIMCLILIFMVNRRITVLCRQQQALCYDMYLIDRSIREEEQMILREI
jgi:hypothetical protein